MKKYNVEKVLYFADGDQRLHVSPAEKSSGTDLYRIVTQQLAAGCLELVATDDYGEYYKTTAAGKEKLLDLQIQWRKSRGKCVEKHSAELDRLRRGRDCKMSTPIDASVSVHIRNWHDIEAEVNEQEGHKYMTLSAGGALGVTLYINDREKALEIASLLERAAQQWEGGE